VPQRHYQEALTILTEVLNKYKVNVINLSVHYVQCDSEAVLSYAPEDSYSFVLYINILNLSDSKEYVCKWTRELRGNSAGTH
jgi:hypothetical protein